MKYIFNRHLINHIHFSIVFFYYSHITYKNNFLKTDQNRSKTKKQHQKSNKMIYLIDKQYRNGRKYIGILVVLYQFLNINNFFFTDTIHQLIHTSHFRFRKLAKKMDTKDL